MKKFIILAFTAVAVVSAILVSCKSKNDGDAITPTYKQEGGTGGNTNQQVTTTGTVAPNNNPTANSTIPNIGGASWSSNGCARSGGVLTQTTFVMTNSTTGERVTLFFSAPPTSGPYTTVSTNNPSTNQVYILVENPQGQPANSQWGSVANKVVTVTVSGTPVIMNATWSNIPCNQIGGLGFFTVTISGNGGCT